MNDACEFANSLLSPAGVQNSVLFCTIYEDANIFAY